MQKVDIEATLEAIRASWRKNVANRTFTDPAEKACNVDGIDVELAYAEWSIAQRQALSGADFVDATGMMLGSFIVACVAAFHEDDRPAALGRIEAQLNATVIRFMENRRVTGDELVDLVMRDVGDA